MRFLWVALCSYLLATALLTLFGYRESSRRLMEDVDSRLLRAARTIKHVLKPAFHDRIADSMSVPEPEDAVNIRKLSNLARDLRTAHLYTLLERDGKMLIAATSATEEELQRGEQARGLPPYDEAASVFSRAFRSGEPRYATHSDRWGTFRVAAVPEQTPDGRAYLACAEMGMEIYAALLRRHLLHSLGIGLLFLLAGLPVLLVYRRSRMRYVRAVEQDADKARQTSRDLRIYKALLENTLDGVSVGKRSKKTGQRQIVWCNDAYVEASGYSRERILSEPHIPDLAEPIWAKDPVSESPGDDDPDLVGLRRNWGECRWKRPDGRDNIIAWHAVIFDYGGDEEWVLTVDRDVTEQRRAAERLEESERRYRMIVENSFDGISICKVDPETHARRLVFANDRFVEMSGRSREELIGAEDLNTIIRPHEREATVPIGDGMSRATGVSSWVLLDGRENYYEWQATYIEVDGERYAIGADHDITDERRTRRALEKSEELYRTTVENTFDGINVFVIDKETGKRALLSCNHRYIEMSGRTREELLACENLMDLQYLVWESEHEEREHGTFVCHGVCSWKRPDGKENYFEWNACYTDTADGIRVIGADRDITERVVAERERRELESKIQHTQKLESLGVLAGGIAHDFNNLLIGILGNADLAAQDLPRTSTARNHVKHIEMAAKRAADLCRQMLAYSGKGRFVLERLDLSEVVKEMGQLLSVSSSKHVAIRYDLTDGLPPVEADATQLRQVAMNLITNAAEAIGERTGMITIATGAIECDADYLQSTYLVDEMPAGLYVSLEVSDNGCGMDRETVERIFEPFFSTKFTGRGLGMAAVLGIVRGHKGAIKVYSEPGRGTTFRILLPACEGEAATRTADPVRSGYWRAAGTVLLVDDEQIVRDVAREMLQTMGFEVVCASDGVEAIEMFRESPDRFALVLLDMTMPRMGGEDTFRELRRIRSRIPIVMSSGYNEQDVVSKFTGKGLAGFVQKPYQTGNLRAILRKVLEETSSG